MNTGLTLNPKSVKARYLLALFFIALLSLCAYLLLSSVIASQAHDARVINVSGRQRMLSQRTSLLAQYLVTATSESERRQRRAQLKEVISLMERSHLALTQGDPDINIPAPRSEAVKALYFSAPLMLDQQVREHLARVKRVSEAPESELGLEHPDIQILRSAKTTDLLGGLNQMVSQYERESNMRISRLKRSETLVFTGTLLALILEIFLIFRPMERAIKRNGEALVHNALHDALTGLPNRTLFIDRLEKAIATRRREPTANFGVLFLDFNRFKVVNDSLGHNIGDNLLINFGQRLTACLRDTDTVARLGGDEFTILLEGMVSIQDCHRVAERINQALAAPFEIDGHMISLSTSIGIVAIDEGHMTAEDVLRDADIAMYRAKAKGQIGFEVFDEAMRESALNLMSLENDLHHALERAELRVHYQPIIAMDNKGVSGFEALVRWQHPAHGLVSPADFIPIAEESGLIVELDRWVMQRALKQLKHWQQALRQPELSISLNVSSQQFHRGDLVDYLQALLEASGLNPGCVHLEITESVIVDSSQAILEALSDLQALGLKLHIDDFGTGYSSLSYLQKFSADALKIDRSFISGLTENGSSAKLIQSIVAMAHSLGMRVVAEGVETEEQLAYLRSLSCEYSQGYFFSKPMDEAQTSLYLKSVFAVPS